MNSLKTITKANFKKIVFSLVIISCLVSCKLDSTYKLKDSNYYQIIVAGEYTEQKVTEKKTKEITEINILNIGLTSTNLVWLKMNITKNHFFLMLNNVKQTILVGQEAISFKLPKDFKNTEPNTIQIIDPISNIKSKKYQIKIDEENKQVIIVN